MRHIYKFLFIYSFIHQYLAACTAESCTAGSGLAALSTMVWSDWLVGFSPSSESVLSWAGTFLRFSMCWSRLFWGGESPQTLTSVSLLLFSYDLPAYSPHENIIGVKNIGLTFGKDCNHVYPHTHTSLSLTHTHRMHAHTHACKHTHTYIHTHTYHHHHQNVKL